MVDWHCTAEDIQAWADGELDGARLQECEAHLQRCEACSRLARQLITISRSLSAVGRAAAPADLRERILESVARAHNLDPIDCDRAGRLTSAYLDDELSALERDLLEAHLFTCADCYARYRRSHSLAEFLRAVPAAAAPAGLHSRIAAAVERQARPVRPLPWRRVAQVAAGLAAAAALTLAVFVPARNSDTGGVAPVVAVAPPAATEAAPRADTTPAAPEVAPTVDAGPAAHAAERSAASRTAAHVAAGGTHTTSPSSEAVTPPGGDAAPGNTSPTPAAPAPAERAPAPAEEPVIASATHAPGVGQPILSPSPATIGIERPAPRPATTTPNVGEPVAAPTAPGPAMAATAPVVEPAAGSRPQPPTRIASAVPYRTPPTVTVDLSGVRDPDADRRTMAAAINARVRAEGWLAEGAGIQFH